MQSLPQRLRLAEAHIGDVPAVADAAGACIARLVDQDGASSLSQPTLTDPERMR
jgi:hypothetical protein